ncbi:hypothetical protein R6Q59_024387 [Mikania micrantha]
MAVAGIHKVSGLDSYLGNKDRSTTQTSFIRKMWRDLENEGRVNNEWRKTCGVVGGPESTSSSSLGGEKMESEVTIRATNEIENQCPQSQNQLMLQEKEDERKMFHEWGSKSFGGHTAHNSSHLNSDCKKVRIVREWTESSTQQGDPFRTTGSEESTTQAGSQVSSIRRIYGRQALIDLLTMFVRERKREVDDLLRNKFVSNFAHRHRIQALLKGRFLRNQRFAEDEKQTSVAANELGFLRQTHAVSDIRKEFLTRLNNYGHAAQSDSDTLSDNEMSNYDHVEQAEVAQETPHGINEKTETFNFTSHRGSHNTPESPRAVGTMHDNNILQFEGKEKLPFTVDYSPRVDRSESSDSDTSSDNDTAYEHTTQVEAAGEIFKTANFTSINPQECARSDSDTSSEAGMKFNHIDQAEEIVHKIPNPSHNPQECIQSDPDSDASSDNGMEFDQIDQAEEIVREIPNAADNSQSLHEDGGWYHETTGSDFQEIHEEEWYENDDENVVDRMESWFGGNSSYLEAALVSRSNTFYWSDDDNDDNRSRVDELRVLTSRRSVSNLLQSDFGARLDQLMQSYVNRQDQAFESENEWMQGDDQQQSVEENEIGIDENAANRFPDSYYHLTTEGEIINGLRIDMEALEQRMNDMQKMLEACMDMQIELQRSVQQEIHSALNRSSTSQGALVDGMWHYQPESSPQHDDCFLCCNDEPESLPDRSAHMLHICSKCAQKVNWSKLKESIRHP